MPLSEVLVGNQLIPFPPRDMVLLYAKVPAFTLQMSQTLATSTMSPALARGTPAIVFFCVSLVHPKKGAIRWMDEILHHFGNHGKPLFVGIYKGFIRNQGFLYRWCEMHFEDPSTGNVRTRSLARSEVPLIEPFASEWYVSLCADSACVLAICRHR